MTQHHCDACGQSADEAHISRRVDRLELATRFRPIHIQILFLAEAPPLRAEDYFYYPAARREERTGLSRIFFDEMMQATGIGEPGAKSDEACLLEFQRRGLFLADSLECPVEEIVPGLREGTARANAAELTHRFGPTIVKRIQFSYKPRHVVLISTRTRHLIPILEQAGLRNLLLLYQDLPLHFPRPDNPAAQAHFRSGMADVLARAAQMSQPA